MFLSEIKSIHKLRYLSLKTPEIKKKNKENGEKEARLSYFGTDNTDSLVSDWSILCECLH